jgi:cytochrome c nitrite reductase small subunit
MKLLLNSLLGVLLGASGYTFYYARGASYMSNDPQACVNCHVMRAEFDSWQKSGHHGFAACNDCHIPHNFIAKWLTKAENGYHHSAAFTLWNFQEPIRIKPQNVKVLNAQCLYCHRGFVSEITAHRVVNDEELSCVRCHDNVGHGSNR